MTNEQTLQEAMEGWINQLKNKTEYYNNLAISLWEGIVGPVIARETEHIYIRNKVLFVKFRSQALKHELEYAKKKLISSINKETGREVINQINFI